jgi:polyphosphate kinase 2 (PPK2 family)
MGKKGGALARLDLSLALTPKQEAARLAAAQARLLQLRLVLGGQIGPDPKIGPPVCVVFEGWDASGKGGAIKRLVERLDPRHVRVAQFGAPSYDEKRHHFLWRFWPVLPGWGGMSVLDRSWYGRVLVERVEGFATDEQWQRAYQEIVGFERTLVDEGMILVKFWLHLSAAEQLKRFKARERDPLKTWKLTAEDWRNRGKRRQYEAAVEEMLDRTDHAAASWVLVEAEDKRWARVKVVESVVAAIETGLAARNLPVPPPQPDRHPRLRRPRLRHPPLTPSRSHPTPSCTIPLRHPRLRHPCLRHPCLRHPSHTIPAYAMNAALMSFKGRSPSSLCPASWCSCVLITLL